MVGLIHTKLPATWQPELRYQAIALVLDWVDRDPVSLHFCDERVQIVAHQVELVDVILLRWVHGNLGRRQSEDQPPVADIDVRKFKHITQESTVSLRVRAVNDRMRTTNHGNFLSILRITSSHSNVVRAQRLLSVGKLYSQHSTACHAEVLAKADQ
jgi:hypothetical protein